MSSGGQVVGGIVGAVAGFFIGGPAGALKGASYGLMIGGMLDPPKMPDVIGPRLSDLTAQTSTYGAVIPRVYGTVPIVGNVFFLENNQLTEVSKTESQGGKGGGGQDVTTFTYFATFAVGLCEGPIIGVRRIWVGSNLIYDAGSSDIETIIASNRAAIAFKIYLGSEDQDPDERMQATLGVADTPAYRGLAYIMFYDFALANYSNSLMAAQVKVEVVSNGTTQGFRTLVTVVDTGVQYKGNFDPGIGIPAILSVDGVVRVTTQGSSGVNVFDVNGVLIGTDIRKPSEPFPGLFGGTNPDVTYPVGIIGRQPLRIQHFIYQPIGTSIILPVGVQNDPGGTGGIVAYDVSSVLPNGEFVGGVSISPDGNHLIVFTAPSNPTLGSPVNKWYLLSFNGIASIIRSGTLAVSVNTEKFGFGNSFTNYGYGISALDSDLKTVWAYYGAGTIDLYLYEIDDVTDVMAEVTHITGLSSEGPISGSIYAKDGIAYLIQGRGFKIFTKSEILSQSSPTLSSIVQSECLKSNLLLGGDLNVTDLTDPVQGYTISSVAAIRSSFNQLQGSWPFDVVQSGYKIKFKHRGGSSVVTIPVSKLDARGVGQAPGVQVTNSREMDSVLPKKVSISYFDVDREYDTGEQYAERLNTPSVNITSLQMAIVMSADEAAKKAEVLLYMYWLERYDVSFNLPPEYDGLEPSDVITITGENSIYELRLTSINYTSDGRLECTAKYNNAAVYTSTAQGSTGKSTGQVIILAGPTQYELLDIPLLDDALDTAGFPVAMAGYLDGWPGGALMRSDDGQTWTNILGFTRPGSTMGTASNFLSAHPGTMIDTASALTVRMNQSLYSVTELQMLNGANYFAYGLDDRWEIIAARNCDEQLDGTYILTNLLRGRYGTEWATGLHAANDRIVALNSNTLQFAATNINTIGMDRSYRGITVGDNLDSDSDKVFSYDAVNLECLSPVYLNGSIDPTTDDWSLDWTRRTRVGGALRDYVDVPLGEDTEAYEVDVFSTSGYATVKRTILVTSASATYSSADQVTDFGSNQRTLYLKVYQMSATVGRGYPLIQSITR